MKVGYEGNYLINNLKSFTNDQRLSLSRSTTACRTS